VSARRSPPSTRWPANCSLRPAQPGAGSVQRARGAAGDGVAAVAGRAEGPGDRRCRDLRGEADRRPAGEDLAAGAVRERADADAGRGAPAAPAISPTTRTDRVNALRRQSKHRGWALDLRVGLAGLFGLTALATAFGHEIFIAGFTAGAVLAATGEPRRFGQQLIGVAEDSWFRCSLWPWGRDWSFQALLGSGRGAAARRAGRRRDDCARAGRGRAAPTGRRRAACYGGARRALGGDVDRASPPGAQSRAGRGDRQRRARHHRRPPPAAPC
jgi:hypothetical protein